MGFRAAPDVTLIVPRPPPWPGAGGCRPGLPARWSGVAARSGQTTGRSAARAFCARRRLRRSSADFAGVGPDRPAGRLLRPRPCGPGGRGPARACRCREHRHVRGCGTSGCRRQHRRRAGGGDQHAGRAAQAAAVLYGTASGASFGLFFLLIRNAGQSGELRSASSCHTMSAFAAGRMHVEPRQAPFSVPADAPYQRASETGRLALACTLPVQGRSSQLVADLTQQAVPARHVSIGLHADRR
jgi:hypothetical protein